MSDSIVPTEQTEAPVDRKALLEQQFDEVEQAPDAPQTESRARDESGKFAKAEKTAEPAPEAEPPVWKRPPASWKKDYHEPWNAIDDKSKNTSGSAKNRCVRASSRC